MGWLRQLKLWYKDRRFKKYGRMGVQETFSEIYRKNMWGGEKGSFYSGDGTADPHNLEYIRILTEFIRTHDIKSVVEIGCGDFSIMQQALSQLPGLGYLGLDIVPDLIKRNKELFTTSLISFSQANALTDPIPAADLLIIRQVLQHLQNDQIQIILSKMKKFRYALITEHVAITPGVIPNLDKVVGPHIRTRIHSGVFIDKPPFSVPHTTVLLEYRSDEKVKNRIVPAVIRTYLVENKE